MGVSIDVYRCHIGIFNFRSRNMPKCCGEKASVIGLSLRHAPALLLLALLLISGIEPNPGPVFKCPTCKHCYNSITHYVHHVKLHQSVKRMKQKKLNVIPCCFGCDVFFANIVSFQSHISRFHKEERKKKQDQPVQHVSIVEKRVVKCPVCQHAITSRPEYTKHMAVHLTSGSSFVCPLPCSRQKAFTDLFSYRTHTARYHPDDSRDFDPVSDEVRYSGPGVFIASPESHKNTTGEEFDVDMSVAVAGEEDGSTAGSGSEDVSPDKLSDVCDQDQLYPEFVIKDELARFYLKLEGDFILPTTQVQAISQEVKLITEFSHHSLKNTLKRELAEAGVSEEVINHVVSKTFKEDPVFNIHHRHEDVEHMGSHHMRQWYWQKRFPYVEPQQIRVGTSENGKARYAQYVSMRESMKVQFRDKKVNHLLQQSFQRTCSPDIPDILSDYHHGSAYHQHMTQHPDGKCFQVFVFQDAFDFSASGPSQGKYKPTGYYYVIGNLPAEHRSKVDLIQLSYMVSEKDLKPTVQEEIMDRDKLKEALKTLLDELKDLKINGIEFNGEVIPVCLYFLIGDSLGQHQVGGFVRNFTSEFFCRFCPISKTEFKAKPFNVKPLRTPEEYDAAVLIAKRKWTAKRKVLLRLTAKKVAQLRSVRNTGRILAKCSSSRMRTILKKHVSKDAFKKMCAVSYRGVKYRPSHFNSEILNFHVSSPAMPVCGAHDLLEGVVKLVVAKVLKYFIVKKEWFDLETLNRRIKSFKCKGSDAHDPPAPLKGLDKLGGNAVQNWNFLRLLPLIIGDLIEDKDDPLWGLFLSLKEIVEFVFAPRIKAVQVEYLKVLIRSYLNQVKKWLPSTLIPKHHFLCHYPDLILIMGPLIRLATLRFESKHIFFKDVVRACRSFVNITQTLAKKYTSWCAYVHSNEIIPPDVIFDSSRARPLDLTDFTEEQIAAIPEDFNGANIELLPKVTLKSMEYTVGEVLILDREDSQDLKVGCINQILLLDQKQVYFLLEQRKAINSMNGYYYLEKQGFKKCYSLKTLTDLPDYYPLPVYDVQQKECISLKHSVICMM